jgi:hypothetical protein
MGSFMRTAAAVICLFGLGVSVTVCGPSAGSFCDAKCDCQGCSNREYDDCLYDYDDDEIRADRRGCLDLFDEYADCVEYDGCRGTDYDHYCETEKRRWKNCVD